MDGVAIVGIGARFPGAANVEEFWSNLLSERVSRAVVPPDRFDVEAYYSAQPGAPGKICTQYGAFIDDPWGFDPSFFELSHREAERVDPQHRVLLEVAYNATEDAGLSRSALGGPRTGVFVGLINNDHRDFVTRDPAILDAHASAGMSNTMAAGRISYFFGAEGPSLSVDTACSSSSVAIHLAVDALLSGQIDLAFAGGVNLVLSPYATICFSRSGMLAPDGICKFADQAADGFVRSDGAGIVILKRSVDAVRDGDRVYAHIVGAATTNDGRGSGQLMTPSAAGQLGAITAACRRAGLSPARLGYIEAHGTGTPVGDPIEIGAIGELMQREGRPDRVGIGSVKSNIGHTESAAGVAGLIKTALSLSRGVIPASVNLQDPTDKVDWANLPVSVIERQREWKETPEERYAGVNSFGLSGTNCHLVLRGAEQRPNLVARRPAIREGAGAIVPISAASWDALPNRLAELSEIARDLDDADLEVFSAHLARRSTHLHYRCAAEGVTLRDAWTATHELAPQRPLLEAAPNIAFVFPGQGGQWRAMGRPLLSTEVGRRSLEDCAEALEPHLGLDVSRVLLGEDADLDIDRTSIAQPCIFAIQVALANQWIDLGVTPGRVIGHSMGEVAAAHVAGALELDEAARVIAIRSRLAETIDGEGSLLLVGLSPEECRSWIDHYPDAAVAVSNGPAATVLTGDPATLDQLAQDVDAHGIVARPVNVRFAAHSPQVDALLEPLMAELSDLRSDVPTLDMISTVSGEPLDEPTDASYWAANLRQPVLFYQATKYAVAEGINVFVELSPNPSLVGAVQQTVNAEGISARLLSSLRRDDEDLASIRRGVATLFSEGLDIDWGTFHEHASPSVHTPPYRWDRSSVRIALDEHVTSTPSWHSVLGNPDLGCNLDGQPTAHWAGTIAMEDLPFLSDHVVDNAVIAPAALYIELFMKAAQDLVGDEDAQVELRTIKFVRPLVVGPERRQVRLQAVREGSDWRLAISASAVADLDDPFAIHASAHLRLGNGDLDAFGLEDDRELEKPLREVELEEIYDRLSGLGIEHGPAFRSVESMGFTRTGNVLGHLSLPVDLRLSEEGFWCHPSLIDGALQVAAISLLVEEDPDHAVVPVGISRLQFRGRVGRSAVVKHFSGDAHEVDTAVFGEQSGSFLRMQGLEFAPLSTDEGQQLTDSAIRRTWWPLDLSQIPPRDVELVLVDSLDASSAHTSQADDLKFGAELDFAQERLAEISSDRAAALVYTCQTDDSPGEGKGQAVELFGVVVALAKMCRDRGGETRLWVVSRSGTTDDGNPFDVAVAGSWGLVRAIAHEVPEILPSCIDVGTDPEPGWRELVTSLVRHGGADTHYRLTNGGIEALRLQRHPIERPPTVAKARADLVNPDTPFRLQTSSPGILSGLALHSTRRPIVPPGQVEIAVTTSGLNFHDVMSAMSVLPSDEPRDIFLGIECAGRISRVGDGVDQFEVGDRVIAMAFNSFASYAITDQRAVAPIPADLSDDEAATITIAFVTAWWSLHDLAHVAVDERVLIHSAAGGLGLAAIQVARHLGGEVLATAGTPEKRALLREQYGIDAVFDSRGDSWPDEIMDATDGHGVDVVLNSLAGNAIEAGLDCLRGHGRFIEVGKRDIFGGHRVDLFPFRNNLAFHAVDLDSVFRKNPSLLRGLRAAVIERFESGDFEPLPFTTYAIDEAEHAFRHMSLGTHVGKILLQVRTANRDVSVIPNAAGARLPVDAAYVVSGGLGGLGLALVEWLVRDQHVGCVVVLGRSAPNREAAARLNALRDEGVEVIVESCDVRNQTEVSNVLESVRGAGWAIGGVFHCALVLRDGTLDSLDRKAVEEVFHPKVTGAENLSAATADDELAVFVTFSSAAGIFGAPGQANYSAANAAMDAVVSLRVREGKPGLSIAWGAWSEVGQAATKERRTALRRRGLRMIRPGAGFGALGDILQEDGVVGIVPIDGDRWAAANPSLADLPYYSALVDATPLQSSSHRAALRELQESDGIDAVHLEIERLVRDEVAGVIGGDGSGFDEHRPLVELGVDSLMAVEVRNRMRRSFGLDLSTTALLDNVSIAGLVRDVATQVLSRDAHETRDS